MCRHHTMTSIAMKLWLLSAEKGEFMNNKLQPESEKREVYCKFIVKNGKTIYPKNGTCFHFFI